MLTRTCIQCNREFTMTESEIRFYKSRKLSLPKRCKECRDENKKNRGEGTGKTKGVGLENEAVNRNETKNVETTKTEEVTGKLGLIPMIVGGVVIIGIVIAVIVLL